MSTGIGERLRRLRHERGLSQEDVARRTGIGLKSYGDLERGKATDPHYSTLRGIARALEVTVEELVEEPVPLAEARQDREHLPSRREEAAFVMTAWWIEGERHDVVKWNVPLAERSRYRDRLREMFPDGAYIEVGFGELPQEAAERIMTQISEAIDAA